MSAEPYKTVYFYSDSAGTSGALNLSLVVSAETFMYAVFSGAYTHPIELCEVHVTPMARSAYEITDTVALLVNNHLLHQKHFEKVNICILNPDYTLVPPAFADNPASKALLSFAGGNTPQRTYHHNMANVQCYFSAPNDLVNYLERVFPQASIRHSAAVSIALMFSHHTLAQADLYLNISEGVIELVAKKNNTLLFYNIFNFNTNEDILYYLLFAMEQFGLDPLTIKLAIAGQRSTQDELLKNIRKYIKHIHFCVSDLSLKMSGDLAVMPQHHYFTLLNQHLCEL